MIANLLAGAVVVVFGGFLIALACVALFNPAAAQRFFMSFASSACTHYIEQAGRLLIGAALVVHCAEDVTARFVRLARERRALRYSGTACLMGTGVAPMSGAIGKRWSGRQRSAKDP